MKTVSAKNLDKLVKEKGWDLTPDSKRAMDRQNDASALTKQVDTIANLVRAVKGVEAAILANKGNESEKHLDLVDRLIDLEFAEAGKQATYERPEPVKGWTFNVVRDGEGFIDKIVATNTKGDG